jgi:hypothetical protein
MAEQHKKNSNLVRDIIIRMSDGLTVPFALTAGLCGVLNTNHLIIVSGLAEITAGCISMGLGGFLATQSEAEHSSCLYVNNVNSFDSYVTLCIRNDVTFVFKI